MDADVNRPNKVLKGPRACATCARAKSRCIPGPNANGGKCERCHRLDKPCSSQTPAPPRKRKEPKPTRVAELERKLENLTARLESAAAAGASAGANQSQGQAPSPGSPEEAVEDSHRTTTAGLSQPLADISTWNSNPITTAAPSAANNPTIDYNFAHIFGADGPLYNQPDQPPSTPSTHLDASSSLGSTRSGGLSGGQPPPSQIPPRLTTPKPLLWPEDAEAEAMLTLYQAALSHQFPFTPIDPRLSSRELREKRPFLWKAAMMSAYHLDGPRQMALGDQLLKEIIEAAMVSAQKDLDLLQGLQLFICWYHYNLKSSQLTNLVFLARSICSSLGLTESTHLNSVKGRLDQFTPKCLENMRALAGTYYITTITFATNRRPDALMNTSCAELCCEIIEKLNKTPSDIFLVWLVRAQQLIQAIVWRLALCQSTTLQPSHMPLAAVIRDFAQQIEVFKQSVPEHIADNPTLIGHMYVAEMLLYEIAIHPSHPDEATNLNLPPSPPSSHSPSASSSHSHSQFSAQPNNSKRPRGTGLSLQDRFDFLWSCLRAAKGFLVNRYAFSLGSPSSVFACTLEEQQQELEYRLRNPRFSCISSSDFIYTFLTSLKLIMLSLPGWDLDIVRREMCFVDFLERQCVEMEIITARRQRQFSQAGAPLATEIIDTFAKLTRKMRSLSEQMRAELETSCSPSQINQQQQSQNQTVGLQQHFNNANPLTTMADHGSSLEQQLTSSSSTTVYDTTEDLMRDLEHHMIWNDMSLDWSGLDMGGVDFAM
ncbi:hypothetical protein V8F20_008490 [Naviculisporaceae sp. PSN 640]